MNNRESIPTYIIPVTLGGQIMLLPRPDGTYGAIRTTRPSETVVEYGGVEGRIQILGGLMGGGSEMDYGIAILDKVRNKEGAIHLRDIDPTSIDDMTQLALDDICMRSKNDLMPPEYHVWPLHEQFTPTTRYVSEPGLQAAAGK